MLEQCDFMELTEEVLQQCKGFTCKDEDITEFFTQDYADYAYQLLGKSYCFVNFLLYFYKKIQIPTSCHFIVSFFPIHHPFAFCRSTSPAFSSVTYDAV